MAAVGPSTSPRGAAWAARASLQELTASLQEDEAALEAFERELAPYIGHLPSPAPVVPPTLPAPVLASPLSRDDDGNTSGHSGSRSGLTPSFQFDLPSPDDVAEEEDMEQILAAHARPPLPAAPEIVRRHLLTGLPRHSPVRAVHSAGVQIGGAEVEDGEGSDASGGPLNTSLDFVAVPVCEPCSIAPRLVCSAQCMCAWRVVVD